MESVFDCKLCSCSYDEYLHKPLSLPCGHVFCLDCLMKQSKEYVVCQIDKLRFDVQPSSLSCCYGILSYLPKHNKETTCIRHPKKNVKFLCKSHEKYLCTECIIDHTGVGHNVVAFKVNSSVVKTEMKDLETIFQRNLKENEEILKEAENKQKILREFYQNQISKINVSYENSLKTLHQKKKEHIANISKFMFDQTRSLEKNKENVTRGLDTTTKLFHQLKVLENNTPPYESLKNTIKTLKQELKTVEFSDDKINTQFFGFKNCEPFEIRCNVIEEIDNITENDIKTKHHSNTHSRPILQNTINDNSTTSVKSFIKHQEKITPKHEEKYQLESSEKT